MLLTLPCRTMDPLNDILTNVARHLLETFRFAIRRIASFLLEHAHLGGAGATGSGSDGQGFEEENEEENRVDDGMNGGQGDGPPGLDALEAGLFGQQQEVLAPSLLRTTRSLIDLVNNLKGKVAHLLATMRQIFKVVKANRQQVEDLTARIQALEEQAEKGA